MQSLYSRLLNDLCSTLRPNIPHLHKGAHFLGFSGRCTQALARESSPACEVPRDGLSRSASKVKRTPEVLSSRLARYKRVQAAEPESEANDDTNDDSANIAMIGRAIKFLKPSDTLRNEDRDSENGLFCILVGLGFEKPIPNEPRIPKRKALLIAVDNAGPNLQILAGPGQDVEQVKLLLEGTFGWPSDCIAVLKDGHDSSTKPTERNVVSVLIKVSAIEQLVADARPGDQLFLYFAGHGDQVPDDDGDEADGKDECIMISDGGKILDDMLHEKLVNRIPAGCHLTVVFDCCSSGTGLDLEHNWCDKPREGLASSKGVIKACSGDVVLLAACEDGKLANEWSEHSPGVKGMFTREVIKFLERNKDGSVGELMSTVQMGLAATAARYGCNEQYPQVSSSRPIEEVLERSLCL